jgi:hypothetical protein
MCSLSEPFLSQKNLRNLRNLRKDFSDVAPSKTSSKRVCKVAVLTQIKFRNLRNIRKVVIKFHVFFLYKTQLTS